MADRLDARLVAVGSDDDDGHVAVSLSSDGGPVVSDDAYDVLIVRRADEERQAAVRDAPAADKRRDGFYRFSRIYSTQTVFRLTNSVMPGSESSRP